MEPLPVPEVPPAQPAPGPEQPAPALLPESMLPESRLPESMLPASAPSRMSVPERRLTSEDVRLPAPPELVSGAWVALLGWLVPGLGQMTTGRFGAGLVLFVVIGGLFLGGLALTDYSCVDPRTYKLEFVAQALIGGPTALALRFTEDVRPDRLPPWREIGSLYVVVAGFLNLIAICSATGDALRRNRSARQRHAQAVAAALALASARAEAERPSPAVVPEGGLTAPWPLLNAPSEWQPPQPDTEVAPEPLLPEAAPPEPPVAEPSRSTEPPPEPPGSEPALDSGARA